MAQKIRSVTSVANVSVFSVAAFFAISAVAAVAQAPSGSIWDGVYTAEQAKRGSVVFQRYCAACHGDTLAGLEAAPPLVGDTFNSTWEGVPLADLFDRIRATMPQDQPGALNRAQNAEVLAYILQSGKFPAGDKMLDAQTMGMVTFRTFRP